MRLLIVVLLAWHANGGEPPSAPDVVEAPITADDRDHWAYHPLKRPSPPHIRDNDKARNPIDCFILARLEENGLTFMPPADRATLIRRVSFDLTGLPPLPDEVDRFQRDRSPNAYERLVDRLLASPAYGERWGQHWLDLARFAETDGFEHDKVRPTAWRYRDWVIGALNRDVPYDQFVELQLAGDELRPGDASAADATGFALCGPDMPDINLVEERRHMVLNDITSTVGAVFLGLQFECAQCHAHKYDPISHHDFYRLRAIFDNVELFKKQGRTASRVLYETDGAGNPSYLMLRGDFRRKGPRVAPAFPRIANPWNETIPSPKPNAASSGRRTALARWLTRPDHPLTTRVIVNRLWQFHFGEGLVRSPSEFGMMGELPTHAELLDWLAAELPRRHWSLKAMHRVLVTSAVYRQASRQANDADAGSWNLAAAENWKRAVDVDARNRLLARMNRRRLDGEAIRDAMLLAANNLSTRRGGRGIMAPLPKELYSTLLKGQWSVSPDREDHYRRSVYLFVRRNLRYPLFDVFDRPDTNATCPQRNRSTIAPQALSLLNSELSLTAARKLAGLVIEQAPAENDARITLSYRRALGRNPTATELAAGRTFLVEQSGRLRQEDRRPDTFALPDPAPTDVDSFTAAALVDFCLALFNLNEFVYVD